MNASDEFADGEVARRIGDWELAETLGRGGAGVVYAATNVRTGVAGALKLAREDRSAIEAHWFAREARLAARLRHPHVVALYEQGRDATGRPYLVYERVEGRSLEDAVDWLDLDAIVRIGGELLDALGYAHDAGVVHCDVTPPNVLLDATRGDAAMLTDFGLAKARDEASAARLAAGIQISGTPGYLSPEQARGVGSPGPASDLFGCGAVLFRALTGYAPYGGSSPMEIVHQTLTSSPLPLRPRQGLRAPVRLANVVQRLLARDPEQRYPSAARARRAWLEAAQTHTPIRGAVRPSMPLRPGLQSMETILVEPLASTPGGQKQVMFSTVRATPAAGLDRGPLRRRFAAAPLKRPAELEAVVSALLPDPSAIVALRGPEGVGKSDVLLAARNALREAGMRVCFARGRQGGRCAPFEALGSAMLDAVGAATLNPLRLAVDLLIDRIQDAGADEAGWGCDALVGGLVGVGPTGARGSAVMEAFRVCEALLEPDLRPAVLVFDDADGVDESTWAVARALVQRLGGRVGVIYAARDAEVEGTTRTVRLEPPRAEDLDAAWATWSGSSDPRPEGVDLPADLHALAGIRERVRASTFEAYLDQVEAPERALLEAAAVFGGDVPERGLLKVAAQIAAPHLVGEEIVLAIKRARSLVDVDGSAARRERWVRMPSPLLRRLVLARMDPTHLAHTCALAAQWLARTCYDDSAANEARVARLAGQAGLPGSAAHAWSEAARIEIESGHLGDAAPYLEEALALEITHETDAVDRPRLRLALAEATLDAGRPGDADAQAQLAERVVEPERAVLRARIAYTRADAAVQQGRLSDALAHLEAALDALGEDGDPMELARSHALMGWVLGYRLGDNAKGIEHGRRALEVAARIDVPAFRASLCGRLGANYLRAGDWDGQLATNHEDLQLSTAGRDVSGIVRANINLGVCFHNRGRLELARDHTEAALALADRCGVAGAAQIAANNLAMIALDAGRDDDVGRFVDRVIEMAERTGFRRALPETRITAARLATRRGELDAAEVGLAQAAEDGDVADLEMAHRAWALLELARDDAAAALTRMEQVLAGAEHDPYERACSRVTQAAALRRAGRDDDARAEEALADAVFTRLGADPALERRRWGG
ncbi:MAG: protein kinase [Sandaracinaceae bacterium]|nr:protein kinase [Sandaracinaceae bacterium]